MRRSSPPAERRFVALTRASLIRMYPHFRDPAVVNDGVAPSNFARVHPFRRSMVYVALRSDGSALAK